MVVSTLSTVTVFDLTNVVTRPLGCPVLDPAGSGYTAVALSVDNTRAYVARFEGKAGTSTFLSCDLTTASSFPCHELDYNDEFGLIRSMVSSPDGNFLYAADNIVTRVVKNPYAAWTKGYKSLQDREDYQVSPPLSFCVCVCVCVCV